MRRSAVLGGASTAQDFTDISVDQKNENVRVPIDTLV